MGGSRCSIWYALMVTGKWSLASDSCPVRGYSSYNREMELCREDLNDLQSTIDTLIVFVYLSRLARGLYLPLKASRGLNTGPRVFYVLIRTEATQSDDKQLAEAYFVHVTRRVIGPRPFDRDPVLYRVSSTNPDTGPILSCSDRKESVLMSLNP